MSIKRLSWILIVSLALRADPASLQQAAGMTKAEFDRLPSSALLDVDGRKVTKGEVVARLERVKSGRVAANRTPNVEGMNRELARKRTLQVAADNAQVLSMKPQSTAAVRVCPMPKIEGIFHVPPLEPGEEFFIKGCGFGKEGKARLEFGEKTVDLTGIEWKDQYLHVRVPEDLGGVRDQEGVSLKVFPPGKVSQPWWPIKFRAQRAARALDRADVSVDCFGPGPVDNNCNQNFAATVAARHTHASFGVGSDRIQLPQLKNGWKYTHAFLEYSCGSNAPTCWGEAAVQEVDPTSSGQTRNVVFVYMGKGLAELTYRYYVSLEGPRDVPFK